MCVTDCVIALKAPWKGRDVLSGARSATCGAAVTRMSMDRQCHTSFKNTLSWSLRPERARGGVVHVLVAVARPTSRRRHPLPLHCYDAALRSLQLTALQVFVVRVRVTPWLLRAGAVSPRLTHVPIADIPPMTVRAKACVVAWCRGPSTTAASWLAHLAWPRAALCVVAMRRVQHAHLCTAERFLQRRLNVFHARRLHIRHVGSHRAASARQRAC